MTGDRPLPRSRAGLSLEQITPVAQTKAADDIGGSTKAKASFVFRWLRQVSRGPALSRAAYRIAIELAQQLDDDLRCKRAHGWFEAVLGASRSYVRSGLAELEEHRHVEIESRRGQGVTNLYRPVLTSVDGSASTAPTIADGAS